MEYKSVLLNSGFIKTEFDCGNLLLNSYIHKQASQDVKRHLAACFIIPDIQNKVIGYYTLSNSSIRKDLIPDDLKSKFPPSYDSIPVTLLGRLARDKNCGINRIGETLLLDALKRCYFTSLTVGSVAVIVDPIDDNAISFYNKYGFISLEDSGKMFLGMKTIAALF